ncbi:MAG: phosphotransferase [Rhizobiaceae bacterium]|nr:phosphotransferase [Hyphomicrobiales bacterium]NRB30891.1 phosphotransferase [Rhizobiaceae bacterium]
MTNAQREQQIVSFLASHGHGDSRRSHLTGDASTRAYELIEPSEGPSLILMNAPAQPDGPPIKDGRPYSQIAHLAEDMHAFSAVAKRLQNNGIRVPDILAQDLDLGLLLIENLGTGGIITEDRQPIADRYLASMETLAAIHDGQWSREVALEDGVVHRLPDFDREAILIEVDLLAQWYAPYRLGGKLSAADYDAFVAIWQDLADEIEAAERSILLRDYHSPNIIWMEGAEGTDRTALIDFQDALWGPTAYDVASIAQDARVTVSADLEQQLVAHYLAHRSTIDTDHFERCYPVLAAQRATKVAGIFVRLAQRDGKPNYLAHLPRVEDYLKRSISHPRLADYRDWLQSVLPV